MGTKHAVKVQIGVDGGLIFNDFLWAFGYKMLCESAVKFYFLTFKFKNSQVTTRCCSKILPVLGVKMEMEMDIFA